MVRQVSNDKETKRREEAVVNQSQEPLPRKEISPTRLFALMTSLSQTLVSNKVAILIACLSFPQQPGGRAVTDREADHSRPSLPRTERCLTCPVLSSLIRKGKEPTGRQGWTDCPIDQVPPDA